MKSLVILFVMLASTMGCSKDDAKSPTQPQVASIELQATHTLIRGYTGEIRQEKITAIVRDENDSLVAGQPIRFAIQDPLLWKGTLDPARYDTVTNEFGEMYVNYNVTLERSGDVIIKATCGDLSALLTIWIEIPTEMPMLSIEPTDPVLYVPANEIRQTTVIAWLINHRDGEAMPGELLHFRVNPSSMGVFDSDTATTGIDGRAIRTFSSVINEFGYSVYGDCKVYVTYGDSSAYAQIYIRP